MLRFLRRYSRWLLAIFGTLLMIVFLVPTVIQNLAQQAAIGGATWATVGENEESVSVSELERVQREMQIIQSTGIVVPPFGIVNDPAHWYLLTREASEAGMIAGRATDEFPLEQLDPVFDRMAPGQRGLANETIAKAYGVRRMIGHYLQSGKISDRRLRSFAQRLFHATSGRIIVIEASARDDAPMPDENAILAHYEKYKDIAPGEGEYGFGYRLPDRYKVEWLVVPRESVLALAEQSAELGPIEQRKYWMRNQVSKGYPPVEPDAAVPDMVRNDLLEEVTGQKRRAVEKFMLDQLQSSRRALPVRDGYRTLPDDWDQKHLAFQTLAERVQQEYSGLALPEYHAVGDRWLTLDDLAELDGLNGAVLSTEGSAPINVRRLIGATKEFGGDITLPPIQQGIAMPVLRGTEGQIVFARLTETDPSRPPHDLDEVRDELVLDLKRLADYQAIVAQADSIEAVAKNKGLLAVALDHDAEIHRISTSDPVSLYQPAFLRLQVQNNMDLIPRMSSLPVIGANREAVEAIIDFALGLPQDKPLRDVPSSERVLVVPVEDSMALLVVELLEQFPLDKDLFELLIASDQFRQTRGQTIQAMLLAEEFNAAEISLDDAFGLDALAKRHNFKFTRSNDDNAADDADTDDDAPPAEAPASARAPGGG